MFLTPLRQCVVLVGFVFSTYAFNENEIIVPKKLISVDRALHVRSLPPVDGLQSNIYEVFMEPYAYAYPPLLAIAHLNGATNDDAESEDTVEGELTFMQPRFPNGPVHVIGNITGLAPGKHALTVHEYGDVRKGCSLIGKHFNPHSLAHGNPRNPLRHVGDLGNIEVNEEGMANVKITDPLITLYGGPRSIIGRAIAIHKGEDDFGSAGTPESLMNGSSGPVVACGVIGIASD